MCFLLCRLSSSSRKAIQPNCLLRTVGILCGCGLTRSIMAECGCLWGTLQIVRMLVWDLSRILLTDLVSLLLYRADGAIQDMSPTPLCSSTKENLSWPCSSHRGETLQTIPTATHMPPNISVCSPLFISTLWHPHLVRLPHFRSPNLNGIVHVGRRRRNCGKAVREEVEDGKSCG